MKKVIINKGVVKAAVAKMVSDKVVVRSFLKGKASTETLSQNGIKLAKPV